MGRNTDFLSESLYLSYFIVNQECYGMLHWHTHFPNIFITISHISMVLSFNLL